MSADELGPWGAWKRKADEMDGDQYHAAQDPDYVIDLLKTAEGRCVLDGTTAHQEVALSATFGAGRRTMERMLAALSHCRKRFETIQETNPDIFLDDTMRMIDEALGAPDPEAREDAP